MSWFYLFVAGIFEVVWAAGLKYSHSFSKLVPSFITLVAMILSLLFLSLSMRTIPLGTAYAVWTGIGTLGTAIYSVLFFGESISMFKTISFLLIVGGVIGLKWCA